MSTIPTLDLADAARNPTALGMLDQILGRAQIAPAETADEMRARLRRADREHWIKLGKDLALTIAAIGSNVFFAYLAITVVQNPTASADDKKWATSIITLFAGALLGYLTGKSQNTG